MSVGKIFLWQVCGHINQGASQKWCFLEPWHRGTNIKSTRLCMYHNFFIHSSVSGHLGCFFVLAFVNGAAMNTCWGTAVFFSCGFFKVCVQYRDCWIVWWSLFLVLKGIFILFSTVAGVGDGGGVQEGGAICILMADSCWCMADTNTILQSNYLPVKNKGS